METSGMDRPRLVLRFRNISKPGVDGVAEHLAILKKQGSVWWGWWKKDHEARQRELLNSIKGEFSVIIISPSEDIQLRARVRCVIQDADPPDVNLIPAYYRDDRRRIPVWFELIDLQPEKYDSALGMSLAKLTSTLFEAYFSGENITVRAGEGHSPLKLIRAASSCVLHISDIHLGKDHNFLRPGGQPITSPDPKVENRRVDLVAAIANDLSRRKIGPIGAVIVTGDIVNQSDWENMQEVYGFFDALCEKLPVDKGAVLVIPGNHDFYRSDAFSQKADANAAQSSAETPLVDYRHEDRYRLFMSSYFGFNSKNSTLNTTARIVFDELEYDLYLGLLNSARWTPVPGLFEYGFVGKDHYKDVLSEVSTTTIRKSVRVLALHHHLLPVQPMEQPGLKQRPVSVTLDSVELLDDAQRYGISLVLHGHQHRPAASKHARLLRTSDALHGLENEDIYVLGAGSAGSRSLPSDVLNTYSLLTFKKDSVHLAVNSISPLDREDLSRTYMEAQIPLRIMTP
jgi:DNA repair exonuclease SbcCD nuclease subunit